MKFVLFNPRIEKILCFFYISHGDRLDFAMQGEEGIKNELKAAA